VATTSRSIYPAILSFTGVALLFGALNLWSLIAIPECCDQIDPAGFPIRFFESGGITGATNFYPLSLVADIVIALAAAAALGFVVWRRTGETQ